MVLLSHKGTRVGIPNASVKSQRRFSNHSKWSWIITMILSSILKLACEITTSVLGMRILVNETIYLVLEMTMQQCLDNKVLHGVICGSRLRVQIEENR